MIPRIHVPSQELWSCPGTTRWRPGCAPCYTVLGVTSWPTCFLGSPSLTTSATAPVSCWPPECGEHLEAGEGQSLGSGRTPAPGRREFEGTKDPQSQSAAIHPASLICLWAKHCNQWRPLPLTLGLLCLWAKLSSRVPAFFPQGT